MAQDVKKFLLSSDYPMPTYIGKYEGSGVANNVEFTTFEIEHGFGFTPLIVGQWALNENFSPAFDIASENVIFDSPNNYVYTNVLSDATKIRVSVFNETGAQKMFYYRLFALNPYDYDGDIPTFGDSTSFTISSDFNYPKLVEAGTGTIPGPYPTDFVVTHNRGYIPKVRCWYDDGFSGGIGLVTGATWYESGAYTMGVIVDEQKLTFKGFVPGNKVYYQIYAEEL